MTLAQQSRCLNLKLSKDRIGFGPNPIPSGDVFVQRVPNWQQRAELTLLRRAATLGAQFSPQRTARHQGLGLGGAAEKTDDDR
jgi:hypothetical protein